MGAWKYRNGHRNGPEWTVKWTGTDPNAQWNGSERTRIDTGTDPNGHWNGHRNGHECTVKWTGTDPNGQWNGSEWSFPGFHMKLLVLGKALKRQFRSVPVFPYSNFGTFQLTSCLFNYSFVRHFMFLMKFWSFPDFHMKLLVLGKALKHQFRSVPVFPYSNFGTFQLTSCSFNDSFVRHFIFLMKFWPFPDFHINLSALNFEIWSFPDFHMKLSVLGKALKRQFRSVPVFPYSNFGTFQLTSCSFNYSFVRHFVFLMKFWSFPDFHMKLLVLGKALKRQFRSVPVFPYSNIGSFQFGSYSF